MSLVHADAVRIPLRSNSVDLICSSPPYWALRNYEDDGTAYAGQIGAEPTPMDFVGALWAWADECHRVLKPSGSMFVNLGDKYAGSGGNNNAGISERATRKGPRQYNRAADVANKSLMGLPWRFALGCVAPELYRPRANPACWHELECTACRPAELPRWVGRAEIVWAKPGGTPDPVRDRVRRTHETWFHLTKSGSYYTALDELREPVSSEELEDLGLEGAELELERRLGKAPGSVWDIALEPLRVPKWLEIDHFAAYPQEWPRRLILGWSPPGICTRCGEGRRPVVETERNVDFTKPSSIRGPEAVKANAQSSAKSGGFGAWLGGGRTITGYACACPDTNAPTRPAVVLDPFGGTGTTAMVARSLDRYPVHLDLSADYLRLARWRIFQSGHAAKSAARTNLERQGTLL